MKQAPRKSLLSPDVHAECLSRIERLSSQARPLWGSMDVAQMLSHCAEIQEVSNGKELKNTPLAAKLFKGMIRKMVVGDSPFPRNTRTHPQYKQTAERDFDAEKKRLFSALEAFIQLDPEALDTVHPLFGRMTSEEKGWAMFKHLDHHLKQFEV